MNMIIHQYTTLHDCKAGQSLQRCQDAKTATRKILALLTVLPFQIYKEHVN